MFVPVLIDPIPINHRFETNTAVPVVIRSQSILTSTIVSGRLHTARCTLRPKHESVIQSHPIRDRRPEPFAFICEILSYVKKFFWRMVRDSNPRKAINLCRFSRPVPSAGLSQPSVFFHSSPLIRKCNQTV